MLNRRGRAFLSQLHSLTEDTRYGLAKRAHVSCEYVEIVGLAGIIDWQEFLLVASMKSDDKPESTMVSLALKNLPRALGQMNSSC